MVLLDDFLEKKYGIKQSRVVEEPEITGTLGTTATKAFKYNPNRLLSLFVNMSTDQIYFAWSPDVGTTKGIILANGDYVKLELEKDAALVFKEAWVVSAGAASEVYSLEVLTQ